MPKALTDTELDELREILAKVEYRLVTSNCQMLAEAAHGEVLEPANSFQLDLAPELAMMKRARDILASSAPTQEQAEKAAVHLGIAKGLPP